jgi:hypothetical protein
LQTAYSVEFSAWKSWPILDIFDAARLSRLQIKQSASLSNSLSYLRLEGSDLALC